MKNKSVFFSFEAPPYGGGAGIYFYMISQRLLGKVDFFTHIRSKKTLNNFCNYFIFPFKLWYLFAPVILLFKSFKYERIIVNDPPFIYASGLMPQCVLKKIVVIIHGRERRWENPSKLDNFFLFKYLFKRGLIKSHNIIFVSDFIKNVYIKEYKLKIKSKTIHNGINSDKIFIEKIKEKNKLKLITVSRLTSGKNISGLLLDIKNIIKDNDIIWDIYGNGEEFSLLYKMIDKYSLGHKIFLHGYIENDKLQKAYSHADCFILNSKLEESFGLVYLEAANYGCHIIGNTNYGAKEALKYVVKFDVYNQIDVEKKIYEVYKNGIVYNQCLRNIDDVIMDIKNEDNIIF